MTSPCNGGAEHCWHAADDQHKKDVPGGYHLDEICCWCPAARCKDVIPVRRTGHGKYAPKHSKTATTRRAWEYVKRTERKFKKNPMTYRQVELLRMIVAGHTRKEIAELWDMKKMSIDSLRQRALKSLKAKNVYEAIHIATKNNYI